MSLLEARLSLFADLWGCVDKLDVAFDLDNAVGNQLDVIGQYVGIKRLLTFQSKFEPPLLTDEYYRILIRAKIFLNHWDGTMEGIYNIWNNIFPDYQLQVEDNQDMSMKVVVSRVRTVFEEELIQHGYITPKPMGVLVNYDSLLSWIVDGMLYAGAYQVFRDVWWKIGFRPPPEDIDVPPSDIYVGGMVGAVVERYSIPGYSQPPDAQTDGNAYIGGVLAENAVNIQIPPPQYGFSGDTPTPTPRIMGAIVYWQEKRTITN
jgi:hypothetical protein